MDRCAIVAWQATICEVAESDMTEANLARAPPQKSKTGQGDGRASPKTGLCEENLTYDKSWHHESQ